MGGAKAVIASVTSAEAMQAISGGLGANGTMMVIDAMGALTVNSLELLGKRAAVRGWYSGTADDSEDALLLCHCCLMKKIERHGLEDWRQESPAVAILAADIHQGGWSPLHATPFYASFAHTFPVPDTWQDMTSWQLAARRSGVGDWAPKRARW